MAKNKRKAAAKAARRSVPVGSLGIADTDERTRQRMEHMRSGAAGTHADSRARRTAPGTYATNRVGSRSAQRRAVLRDWS